MCERVYACALCLKGAAFVCLFFPLDERRYKHSTGPVWIVGGYVCLDYVMIRNTV